MAGFEYWYPWYPVAFRRDTMHLTLEQDGLYRRLIDHYMETRQPIPNNDIAIARIAGVSTETWLSLKDVILPFFAIKQNDGKSDCAILCHKKCDKVLSNQTPEKDINSSKKSMAGKLGAKKRWMAQNSEKPKQNKPAIKVPLKTDSTPMANDSKEEKRREDNNTPIIPLVGDMSFEPWVPKNFTDFLELRKSLKAKNTQLAVNSLLKTLKIIVDKGYKADEVVENSIRNSWKDLFLPKTPPAGLKEKPLGEQLKRISNLPGWNE